jgi:hypothetical protein
VVPCPVVCVKLAAVIAAAVTSLAELIVIAPNRVVPPTTPVSTTLPTVPAVNPRLWAPFSVLPKVMLLSVPTIPTPVAVPPVVVIVIDPPSEVGSPRLKVAPFPPFPLVKEFPPNKEITPFKVII